MKVRSALCRGFLLALCLPAIAAAQAPAAPALNPAVVTGTSVAVSWSAVASAISYRVEASSVPGVPQAAYEVGPITSFSINVPPGTYYLRVQARNLAGLGAWSNVITIVAGAAVPAPPQNFQVAVSGNAVSLSVQLPPGPLTALGLGVGRAPGANEAVFPLPVGTQATIPSVPNGVYYARLYAANAAGVSAPSNEVQIVVPSVACTPPPPPTFAAQVSGTTVAMAWGASGAAAYRLDVSSTPGGPAFISQPFPGSTTSLTQGGVVPGTYYARVTAANGCGQATSPEQTIAVVSTGGTSGPRTPNPNGPTPPNYLPLPNREAVVMEMARLYPADLRASCVEAGGNNRWLFRLVERLRREDTRWGLNWKRARVGDMSQDVVTYNYGPEGDEGTRFVHVVDVIAGHCGGSPSGAWINQTVLWSTGAMWTLQPYLQAGLPQFPQ
jgi:hypothetical protein